MSHRPPAPPPVDGVQSADAVLMVRPASFGWNPETHASNAFQRDLPHLAGAAGAHARAEFDALRAQLVAAGVEVCCIEDTPSPVCPDAIFPNNWVSLHADGTVVLYPMLAPNRRLERRLESIGALAAEQGRSIRRLLDLTHYESRGQCLEGTGSVVFDHEGRVAYACLSPRTHPEPLAELCAELGYAPCEFTARDPAGVPIYHTNVMLALGTGLAVVAADAIVAADRERVLECIGASGRHVEVIDAVAMARFAGNVLEVRSAQAGRVLALSASAAAAFGDARLARIHECVDRLVVAAIPTIETLGGGSVRCMLAEVFLPRVPD